MRNLSLVALFLLVSLTWAIAQTQSSPSQAPPAGTNGQSSTSPGASAAQPQAPTGQGNNLIEGCLGGTAPDFTVTDAAGTVYKLDFPKTADTSVIAKHVGESVQVMGSMNQAASEGTTGTAASPGTAASSGNPGTAGTASAALQRSIQVAQMGTSNGACPGAANGSNNPSK